MTSRASRINYPIAEQMLRDGASVLDVAYTYRVSPQAVYDAIRRGRIERPATNGGVVA